MEKITLRHQAATVLAECKKTGEFFFGQYDKGFPGNKDWIGRVKLLGGNFFYGKNTDPSPLATYQREISVEEFSGTNASEDEFDHRMVAEESKSPNDPGMPAKARRFASFSDVTFVRNALMDIRSYKDYLCPIIGSGIRTGKDLFAIYSVFYARLSKKVIECVKDNNKAGLALINEGDLRIASLDDLLKGDPMCAAATGLIIGDSKGVVLPYSFEGFTIAPLEGPRGFYEDYLKDFDYIDHSGK